MGWATEVRFPVGAGIFLFINAFRPASYPMGTGVSFPEGKEAGG